MKPLTLLLCGGLACASAEDPSIDSGAMPAADSATPTPDSTVPEQDGGQTLAELGDACTASSECATGHCLDLVAIDDGCSSGVCVEACNSETGGTTADCEARLGAGWSCDNDGAPPGLIDYCFFEEWESTFCD